MSDKENTTAEETKITEKNIGNGVVLKLEKFSEKESPMYGFQFWRKKFLTAAECANHFTLISKGGKSGDEIVCSMVNSALAARMRSQATQAFISAVRKIKEDTETKIGDLMKELTDEELDQIKKDTSLILITEEDATEYTPGEREVSAVSGLRKQKDDLLKAIKKLKEEGAALKTSGKTAEGDEKIKLAKEKLTQFYEVDKQLKSAEAEAEEKLLEMLKD